MTKQSYELLPESEATRLMQAGLDQAKVDSETFDTPNSAMLFYTAVLAAHVASQIKSDRQKARIELIAASIEAMLPFFVKD